MRADRLLLGLIGLALVACARAQFTAADLTRLPACQDADADTFVSKLGLMSTCSSWFNAASASSCPADCTVALEAIGEECFAAFMAWQYEYLGMPIDTEVAQAYANATFNACETGTPNALEAEAALYEAAYSKFPSCASADYEAALSTGCTTSSIASSLSGGGSCSTACATAIKAYGAQCQIDVIMGMLEKVDPSMASSLRPQVESLVNQCIGSTRRLLRENGAQLDQVGQTVLAALARAIPLAGFV